MHTKDINKWGTWNKSEFKKQNEKNKKKCNDKKKLCVIYNGILSEKNIKRAKDKTDAIIEY